MIAQLIRKILKLDENDRKIEAIQAIASRQFAEATVILNKAGKMHEIMVKKTTTFYIAKAIGAIK